MGNSRESVNVGPLNDAEAYVKYVIDKKNIIPDCSGFVYNNDFGGISSIMNLTTIVQAEFLRDVKIFEQELENRYVEWERERGEYLVEQRERYLENASPTTIVDQAKLDEWSTEYQSRHHAPVKNLKQYLKQRGVELARLNELEIFCNRYAEDHDEMYLQILKSRIVVKGDYEEQYKIFKEKLYLNDFEAKAVAKWVQNVKRRVLGINAGTEFALLLSGEQGTGKSLFASRISEALGDGVRKFNVEELSDKDVLGNCASTGIMIFDEFKVTDRVGLEILKRAITLTKYDWRPAYSRLTKSINSITSFICSSNERLSDLVIDSENRRFIEINWDNRLPVRNEAVYEYYNTIDWIAFFNSVPVDVDVWTDAEYNVKHTLTKSNVKADEFRDFFIFKQETLQSLVDADGWITSSSLIAAYNAYREELGLKYPYDFKKLSRDCKILECEKKKNVNGIFCYYIKHLIHNY